MPRAPATAPLMTEEDRRKLRQIIGLRSVPQSVALRVRIVLGGAEAAVKAAIRKLLSAR